MGVAIEELQIRIDHRQELEGWILCALNEGVQDFWELVCMLPGAFPTDVRAALNSLVAQCTVPYDLTREVGRREGDLKANLEIPGLPTPHPLAFDWRFTRRTAETLLGIAIKTSGSNGVIGLLGSPSVFFLSQEQHCGPPIKLLDQNPFLAESLSNTYHGGAFHRCDITQTSVDANSVSVVIADPPWYMEDALEFLRTSSRLCVEEGTVLFSYAAEGSKPGVGQQRQDLIAKAAEMGLKFDGDSPLALSYVTPFFEHNALLASGFTFIPRVWRRGDMLIFKKTGNGLTENFRRIGRCEDWKQFEIGRIGIWVRVDNNEGFVDPCLQHILDGDVLPSVSRSDARRQNADVWTCGNRVFRCDGSNVLSIAINAMANGQDPLRSVAIGLNRPLSYLEAKKVSNAVRQVKDLVELEQRELGSLRNV